MEEYFLVVRQTVRKKLDQSLNRKLRRALGGQVDRIFDEIADQAKAAFLDEPSPPPRQPAAKAAA